jgi:hypothetical protein
MYVLIDISGLPRWTRFLDGAAKVVAKGVSQERCAGRLECGLSASFKVKGKHGEHKGFEARSGSRGRRGRPLAVRANKNDAGAAAAATTAADMLRAQLGGAKGTTKATHAAAPIPVKML